MSRSQAHGDEERVRAVLSDKGLLDAPLEAFFAQALELANALAGTPAACVVFAAPEGARVKASVGRSAERLSGQAFKAAARSPAAGEFECDAALADGLGRHVGIPLKLDGVVVGALCVAAADSLELPVAVLSSLEKLGGVVSAQLERERDARRALERAEGLARYEAQRFKDFADSMPVFLWTATAEGVVNYFGKPLADFAGVSLEALYVPGAWVDLLHPDDREAAVEIWSHSVHSGEPYATKFRIRDRIGGYRWFWVTALPVRDDGGEISIWYGCATDIHEELQLRQEAHDLAERLTATFASIQDAFFTLDANGRVSAINDEATRVFARGQNVVGEPAWLAMEALGRSRIALDCRIAAYSKRTVRFECFLETVGRWYDVSIFPAASGVTVLLRDIDARMRDELTHTAEARVLGMIASEAEVADILECAVRGVEAALPGMIGSILLYDAQTGRLTHGAAPGLPQAYVRAIDGREAGPAAGSCGTAAWTGEPVIVGDIEADARWNTYRDLALPHGLKACWSMPVLGVDRQVMATVAMYYRHARYPTDDDIALLRRTVNLVAIAIARSREQGALRVSEERFRGMFRDSDTGMVIASVEGRFIEANEAFCRMLGYSFDELQELDFLALTHEDDRQKNRELYELLLDGNRDSFVIEKRYWTRQRKIVWARVSVTIQRDDGKPVRLVAVTEDVTVRRLAEEALQQQSALLAMASRLGKLGAWLVEQPGRLIWSEEVRGMLEAPPGYIPSLEHDVASLYPPGEREAVAAAVAQCMEEGKPIDMQADIHTLKGKLLRVHILGEAVRDESGRILRVQGALQDITEHYQLVHRLADSEARFREIAENIRDVFWVRSADGSIVYVSPAYERIWGRTCAELYANPSSWLDAIHPEDRPRVLEAGADIAADYQAEYRILLPDGTEYWIVDTGFPVCAPDGSVLRVTGVARDITARKRAEEGLRLALERLARSNRELEDFAYVASHDLQEPLRKITVFSDRLAERAQSLDGQERDYLERMSSAANRMQTLIFDLLEYSRIATRAQPLRTVALDGVLDEVLDDLEVSIAEAGARVEREALPEVVGDARQLQQLMQNLIGNALKFRQPGVAPVIRVSSGCKDGFPCLCVADNGIGIEEAHLERIFRPFQRLHGRDEYPGSGIGLAIVKKIAERHGAYVEVVSRPGEGAEFRVYFAGAAPEEEG